MQKIQEIVVLIPGHGPDERYVDARWLADDGGMSIAAAKTAIAAQLDAAIEELGYWVRTGDPMEDGPGDGVTRLWVQPGW